METIGTRGIIHLYEIPEEFARDAVAFAETSDFLLAHADAMTGLAEVLELQGKHTQAANAFREALDLHERKGNVPAAARTRTQLTELSPLGLLGCRA